MKVHWSLHWKASKQPRKQRKYQANAPLHVLHHMISSPLSTELRKKYNTRNVPIHTGDTVKVMRGSHKGKTGKVERVITHRQRIIVTGVTNLKRDGTKIPYALHPSKVRIIELNLDDKRRIQQPEKKQS